MRDDKVLGSTVRIDCTTHDSTGALVAPSSAFAASDFRIYKDGSAAEKTSTNGITVTSPFDSIVGKHLIEIDTSNSTGDSGFWAAGSEYRVELNSAKTISSIVQSGVVVGRFTLVAAGVLRPTTDGRTLDVSTGHAATAALDSTTSTKIDNILEDTGTTLPAQIAGISGGSGSGARSVTITVNDGTSALQNATVRMTEGVNTYTALTNASGIATFNLDDATYTVSISKAGYSYSGTTIVVNGTETATYSMTAISVTPGTGNITTGYLTCLDEEGAAEEGVSVRCQMVQVPASGTGIAYDSAVQLATSDADGLVEFSMIKGARYLVWRGSIKPPQGLAPTLISASAGTTTALGSLIGVD